ncbi:hypothetical protein BS47DRAFT_1369442 [Hydnum rufescens UP504]|uniref:Uncharacterized protein n=1 Tax=Hydnum rufescens UP504 TaxID=1448309 RepID=A0A9P6DLU6_9AGAM|nr:hypothetical protein BS47DRAFT_1369442 [Hydnum rufescens UP504]
MNWRAVQGDGVLPHVPSKASQKSGLSREDNNSGSEHPPRHATNKFSTRPVVEVLHSRHAAAPVSSSSTRAQSWMQRPRSGIKVQSWFGASPWPSHPPKCHGNGNAWNAFQALYKKDHPNTDPSVSAWDYTVNMVQPAYAQLIESFGGEESPEWATEPAQLIAEHESVKVGATKLVHNPVVTLHGLWPIKRTSGHMILQWLATMDIHTMFLMVTGNAASPAAHAQKECRLGSKEMAAWTAIKDTLIGLFSPFVKMTKFPWTNLTKVLVQNKLIISNFVPNNEFPNFGMSLSDLHTTDQYKTLYYALEESSPEKKIVITKVDNWPVGEAEDVALITDRHGEVILLLAAAQDYTARHGAGETGGGEGSKGVKWSGMDTGLDDRRGNKTTVGKRKKAAVKSVALIRDESEDADSVDNLLSFGSRAASHDSSNSSSIPRGHSSLHNQQQLPNQPHPKPCFTSSLSITTAPLPVLNGLGHLENVNIGKRERIMPKIQENKTMTSLERVHTQAL